MQNGISLTQLAQRIEAAKELKADYVASCNHIEMTFDKEDGKTGLEVRDVGRMPILHHAHGQIAAFTDIPAKYYRRMEASKPELLCSNVNTWLESYGKRTKRMIRGFGGDVRAFLSDRYRRIEHEQIAEAILPVLMSRGDIQIRSCEITDRKMYIHAVTDEVAGEVKVGDPVRAGLIIRNSEIGDGALDISPFIERLVCKNGLIIPDGRLRAFHLGRRVAEGEDLNQIFKDDTRAADDKALMLKARDAVNAALSQATLDKAVERMRELSGIEMPAAGKPEKAVQLLAKEIGASEQEGGGILQALIRGGDLSAWGFVNAVTYQAHTGDYDRAVELEAAGGKLLELTERKWESILSAA